MGYSVERRESVLKKMLPPNNASIAALAIEEGISDATLYLWRKQAGEQGRLMPDSDTIARQVCSSTGNRHYERNGCGCLLSGKRYLS